jgi:hypothetical protein
MVMYLHMGHQQRVVARAIADVTWMTRERLDALGKTLGRAVQEVQGTAMM